jgi:hypothetical protein
MKVYKYGLQPPITDINLVNDQMYKGHNYQNKLVEIEIKYRDGLRSFISKSDNIPQLEEDFLSKQKEFELIDQKIKKNNSEARVKVFNKGLQEAKKSAKEELKKSKKILVEARQLIMKSSAYKDNKKILHDQLLLDTRKVRTNEEAPWYGTYMLIEQAHKLATKIHIYDGIDPRNPKFRRFTGGRIGINQFIPHEPINKVIGISPTSKKVQIVPLTTSIIKKDGSAKRIGKKDLRLLRVRIGSNEKREPIWAEFPIIYHRPLPINAPIAQIQILKRFIGPREKWTVSITVDETLVVSQNISQNDDTTIAFDLGWREYSNENKIVIATGFDTNDKEIEIAVEDRLINRLLKVNDLKSIRDKKYDLVRQELIGWIKNNNSIIPNWLIEETKTIYQWKSKPRLITLIKKWENNRFDGDENIMGKSGVYLGKTKNENKTIFNVVDGEGLLGWKYNDFHLWKWETSQSVKTRNDLKEFYRKEAAKLASQYETIIFENINGNNLAKGKVGSTNRQLTAPFEFRSICKMIFAGRGKNYKEVPARYSSMECNDCHFRNEKTSALEFFCDDCGKEIQRDRNAAKNLLDRGIASG